MPQCVAVPGGVPARTGVLCLHPHGLSGALCLAAHPGLLGVKLLNFVDLSDVGWDFRSLAKSPCTCTSPELQGPVDKPKLRLVGREAGSCAGLGNT